jgi:hypothetical protein
MIRLALILLLGCSTPPALSPSQSGTVVTLDDSCDAMHPSIAVELQPALDDYCDAGLGCATMRRGTGGDVHVRCLPGRSVGIAKACYYDDSAKEITCWPQAWSGKYQTWRDVHLVPHNNPKCYASTRREAWVRARTMLKHELGHAYGWRHSCNRDEAGDRECAARQKRSIMYPYSGCRITPEPELRP